MQTIADLNKSFRCVLFAIIPSILTVCDLAFFLANVVNRWKIRIFSKSVITQYIVQEA
jgi:hypothetical protein